MHRISAIGLSFHLAAVAMLVLPLNAGQPLLDREPPMEQFVHGRPRLFVNADILQTVTQYAARAHSRQLEEMRAAAAAVERGGETQPAADYGVGAAAAAFLYLMEPSPGHLAAATGLLWRSVAYYRKCDREGRAPDWYSFSRIHAFMAYDWLHDAMPEAERKSLGSELMEHVRAAQSRFPPLKDRNAGDYRSGFYGEPSLVWYAGLALKGAGVDEGRADAAIRAGYNMNMLMLEHRARLAGDDGGGACATAGYAFRADPWAEFNFFQTLKSAFNLDVATNWPHAAMLPHYALWTMLPGGYEFGAGDAYHVANVFPGDSMNIHLRQVRHFYGRSMPEYSALAGWIEAVFPRGASPLRWSPLPFLLTDADTSPAADSLPPGLPLARHFEGMGQVVMRSGWGDDATCALFTAGGLTDRHKHFDENGFTLFHKGFLALDSGTRTDLGRRRCLLCRQQRRGRLNG